MKDLLNYFAGVLLLCTTVGCYGQDHNLVINPGFEDPNGVVKRPLNYLGTKGEGINIAKGWVAPMKRAPEVYYDPDFQIIESRGEGMAGMTLHRKAWGFNTQKGREYLEGHLKHPLQAGKAYCVCMDISLHRTSKWSVTNVGIQFQDGTTKAYERRKVKKSAADVYLDRSQYVTNQDWRTYCTTYLAEGGERSFLVGTFGKTKPRRLRRFDVDRYQHHDVYTARAYYMMDNFVVKPLVAGECGCSTGYQEEVERNTTTLVLDVSTSMREHGVSDTLVARLRDWVDLMADHHGINIVEFASDAKLLYQGSKAALSKDSLNALIEKMELSGGTNVFKGLEKGYKHMAELKPQDDDSADVVLITDGRFNITDKMINLIKRNNQDHGASLTVVHVNNRADYTDRLAGLGVRYYSARQKELSGLLTSFYAPGGDASTCACTPLQVEVKPKSYMFVLDHSGSMEWKAFNLRWKLKRCLKELPEHAPVSLISFNTKGELLFEGTRSQLEFRGIRRYANSSLMGGGTSPSSGLLEAYKHMDKYPPAPGTERSVVLLSDYGPGTLKMASDVMPVIRKAYEEKRIHMKGIRVRLWSFRNNYYEYYPYTNSLLRRDKEKFCDPGGNETITYPCGFYSEPYVQGGQPPHAVATWGWLVTILASTVGILVWNSKRQKSGQ